MALNANTLKNSIIQNLRNIFGGNFNKPGDPKIEQTAQAIADAVVSHITANAIVTVNVNVNLTADQAAQLVSIPAGGPVTLPTLIIQLTGNGTGRVS